MDNSKYIFGTDLYLVNRGGNSITDWVALAKWAHFVYLRASIGQIADVSFTEAANAARAAGILVGAYHELWPDLNLTFQADTFNAQIKSAGFSLDLPPAVAFEQQNISIKDRSIPTYPNPADLVGMASRVPDMIIYIGMDGLHTCKDAGFDFSKFRYWISEYMLHQSMDGEYPIVNILKNIAAFGITQDQLLFAQTADALPYPPGISPDLGADYDRAVSFAIPTPNQPPAPPPVQTIVVTVQSSDMQTKIESVVEDGVNKTSISNLVVIGTATPPAPQPVPVVNRYRILFDWEMPASYYDSKSRTAAPDWNGNPITPGTVRINGVKSSYSLTPKEVAAITNINAPYPKALQYVSAHQGGWVNYGNWPNVETLTFEGNFVDVLSVDPAKNRAYIRVWNGEDGSGADDDCVIHHWTNIGPRGQVYLGSWHGPAFIALMYEVGAWIPLDKLIKV